jgi:hypothetical protein
MDEVRRQREAIFALAQQRNLALTGGSDNHGWGRAAPNWTLMIIFGWRGLAGDALGRQIENVIRKAGTAGTRVIERRVADGTNTLGLALTIAAAPGRMFTTLSTDERISWLIWIWLLTATTWWTRRRRA